ncbi:hydrolase [Syntrophomonas erecta]
MKKFKLDAQDTLLVVIDLQEKLMNAMKDRERVYKNTNLLINVAKTFDIPVVVTEQYPRGLGKTVPEISDNLPACEVFEKTCFSACLPGLMDFIRQTGRKTIIVTGSETHVCVFQTARDLIEAGYYVHLVRDAVCSRFDENYENALSLMQEMGAVITNAETVTFDLLKEAGTPQFKAISPLVK